MMNIPVTIVIGVIVFVLVAAALYYIFGSPTCDEAAKVTTAQLRITIDSVANEALFYNGNDVPSDSTYFRSVPIKLCEDKFGLYEYFRVFTGGQPQYQIYYEKFPEGFFQGGAWMWTENYPWSGGAGQLLFFWGGLRGVTLFSKFIKTTSAIGIASKVFDKVKNSLGKVREGIFLRSLASDMESVVQRSSRYSTEFLAKREASTLAEIVAEEDVKSILRSLGDADVIKVLRDPNTNEITHIFTTGANAEKIVFNDNDIPSVIFKKIRDPNLERTILEPREVWAFKNADGTLDYEKIKLVIPGQTSVDELGDSLAGYAQDTINPSKVMQDFVNDLKSLDPNGASDILATFDFVGGSANTVDNVFKSANYAQKLYKNTIGRVENVLNRLRLEFYRVDITTMSPGNFIRWVKGTGRAAVGDGDAVKYLKTTGEYPGAQIEDAKKYVFDPILNEINPGIKKKIAAKYGLTKEEEATNAFYINKFLNEEIAKRQGMAVFPKKARGEIWFFIQDTIEKNPSISVTDMKALVKNTFTDLDTSYFTDIKITNIFDNLQNYKIFRATTTEDFESFVTSHYITTVGQDLKNNVPGSANELGIVIGFLRGDSSSLPILIPPGLKTQYGIAEFKKLVFIDGRALVTPGSWITQALFVHFQQGCLGNSMCLYQRGQLVGGSENPYYLSNESSNYFVRIWRPVNNVLRFSSIQAALSQIPSNPRFYSVSPCYAIAKVWKTLYDGDQTIFVYPEKIDLGDKASNYCYADESLLNQYYAIWFASDTLTAVELVLTGGTSLGWRAVVRNVDPVTFGQAMAEAAVAWPRWPFKPLTYDIMLTAAGETSATQLIPK